MTYLKWKLSNDGVWGTSIYYESSLDKNLLLIMSNLYVLFLIILKLRENYE